MAVFSLANREYWKLLISKKISQVVGHTSSHQARAPKKQFVQ